MRLRALFDRVTLQFPPRLEVVLLGVIWVLLLWRVWTL